MALIIRFLLGLAFLSTAAVASGQLNINTLNIFLSFVEPMGKIDKNNYKEDVVKIYNGYIKEDSSQNCSLVISNVYNIKEKFRTILFAIIPLYNSESPSSKTNDSAGVEEPKRFSESALSYIDFSVQENGAPKEIIQNQNYEVVDIDADTFRVQMRTKEFQVLSDGGQDEIDQKIEIYFQEAQPIEASFEFKKVGTNVPHGFTCVFDNFSI